MDFVAADGNHVERNVLNNNGGGPFATWGLHFNSTSDDNTYGRNSATGNLGPAGSCPASPAPDLRCPGAVRRGEWQPIVR